MVSRVAGDVRRLSLRNSSIARAAYRDFGRGTSHPAGLNLGDCFAYALARETGEPLLFKGGDFGHTDIPFIGSPGERHRIGELHARYASDR